MASTRIEVKKLMTVLMVGLALSAASQAGLARVSGLPDFTELVESAGPAVVNIRVAQFGQRARPRQGPEDQPYDEEDMPEFFRRFFDVPDDRRPRRPDRIGAGSGFIIDTEGFIITNHHVIEEADEIIVRLADRREFEAELIGSDELSDIALLKIEAEDLTALEFGDSGALRQGEWVAAIGSPFNFEQSITAGIVSAKGRTNGAQQYVPFIQTDVAINRGNSGGPLLNMDGKVVGVNSWILTGSGGYIGLSFSIPIEVAARTVEQLRTTGEVRRGLMGVIVGQVTREMAEALNLDRPVGALVNDVNEGSAAARAGIQPGDVILEFDGEVLETWNELPPLVGANPPGTEVDVLISRNGEQQTVTVVLDALPTDADGGASPAAGGERASNALGLAVESISGDRRRELGDPEGGVVIIDVESDAAYRAGLRPGDVVLMINNRVVGDMDDFEAIVADVDPDRAVALRVWRNGATSFIAYTPEPPEIE